MTARLLLIRHGESVWNAEGRMQGQQGTGLTARGRAQAQAAADRLRALASSVDLVARSDLERVAETAQPIEAALSVPVRVDERLREAALGSWEGRIEAEVDEEDPDALAAWERFDGGPGDGGEALGDFQARVMAALDEVVATAACAVVVTHGGCVRIAVAAALGMELADTWRLAPAPNGSITTLERGADWRVLSYGETGHLLG